MHARWNNAWRNNGTFCYKQNQLQAKISLSEKTDF